MSEIKSGSPSNKIVLILFFFLLVALIVLLIFLYKKLNKEANGEYTIRRMVYKEGGVRDRMRGAAMALESRLGVQLWPRSGSDEDGEEMQDIRDEEGEVEGGSSQGSDSEGDDQEKEEEDEEQSERGGTSDDNSSLASSEAGEQTRLQEPPKGKGETGVGKENEEKADGEGKGEASERAGLSLNLNQLTGSAIWFEEGGKGKDSDVTAL